MLRGSLHRSLAVALCIGAAFFALLAFRQAPITANGDGIVEGFRLVEAASAADAMEQLYGKRQYMVHDMRPLAQTKFAGPAVTVLMKKEENREGAAAIQGALDTIDEAPAGSVYVMTLDDGLDYAGIGGLMSTAMKFRNLAGAVVDGSVRDTAQIARLQFPVFSRGIAPSSTVSHYRFAGKNIALRCGGVEVRPGDIIVADMDGVVVVPIEHAAAVLARAQQLDNTEHSMYPFIEKFKSIREAVAKFGRI
jgi:4-hydroxy-4-methyl-2-oxoglutarate aldolase